MNSNYRKISKDLILNVVKARLDEIFNYLKKQLIVPGFDLNSGINFLLLGAGSNFTNLEKYCSDFFETRVKSLDKNNINSDEILEKNFSSSLGALRIIKDGWETEAIPEFGGKNIEKIGFLSKIFGN